MLTMWIYNLTRTRPPGTDYIQIYPQTYICNFFISQNFGHNYCSSPPEIHRHNVKTSRLYDIDKLEVVVWYR